MRYYHEVGAFVIIWDKDQKGTAEGKNKEIWHGKSMSSRAKNEKHSRNKIGHCAFSAIKHWAGWGGRVERVGEVGQVYHRQTGLDTSFKRQISLKHENAGPHAFRKAKASSNYKSTNASFLWSLHLNPSWCFCFLSLLGVGWLRWHSPPWAWEVLSLLYSVSIGISGHRIYLFQPWTRLKWSQPSLSTISTLA